MDLAKCRTQYWEEAYYPETKQSEKQSGNLFIDFFLFFSFWLKLQIQEWAFQASKCKHSVVKRTNI